jgi:hypothetical protein
LQGYAGAACFHPSDLHPRVELILRRAAACHSPSPQLHFDV